MLIDIGNDEWNVTWHEPKRDVVRNCDFWFNCSLCKEATEPRVSSRNNPKIITIYFHTCTCAHCSDTRDMIIFSRINYLMLSSSTVNVIDGVNQKFRRNHRTVTSHWQSLSHNGVHLALIAIRTHNISCDRYWLRINYLMLSS
jgi:hypothetical protein